MSAAQYSDILNLLNNKDLKKNGSIKINDKIDLRRIDTLVFDEVPDEINVEYFFNNSKDDSKHRFIFNSANNETDVAIEEYLKDVMSHVII